MCAGDPETLRTPKNALPLPSLRAALCDKGAHYDTAVTAGR
jgi:hypothetical protein